MGVPPAKLHEERHWPRGIFRCSRWFFDPVMFRQSTARLTGVEKPAFCSPSIRDSFASAVFFMKFRGPKALGNRRQKTIVCPTLPAGQGRSETTGREAYRTKRPDTCCFPLRGPANVFRLVYRRIRHSDRRLGDGRAFGAYAVALDRGRRRRDVRNWNCEGCKFGAAPRSFVE